MTTDIAKLKELIDKSKDILIVTHGTPTMDSIGSVLTMYLGLTGLGKKVTVACPDPATVEFSNFIGVDKLVTKLSKKNFIVSLDYVEGSIDKVSYNIDGDKFNLVIEPRPGFDNFSSENVRFFRGTGTIDCIIIVDTLHLGALGNIYEEDRELFASKPILNIDTHAQNTRFGQINIVEPISSATIELSAVLLSSLGVKLTVDIATNILNAIYSATDNFTSSKVNPRTHEVAAVCIKAGGKRFAEEEKQQGEVAQIPILQRKPMFTSEEPKAEPKQEQPIQKSPVQGKPQPPEEWLKPKIFKSSNN